MLLAQIEFCDVLIVNKSDLVEEAELIHLEKVLHKLQPAARLIRTSKEEIQPSDILNTGLSISRKPMNQLDG